jgi:hypothetical protein
MHRNNPASREHAKLLPPKESKTKMEEPKESKEFNQLLQNISKECHWNPKNYENLLNSQAYLLRLESTPLKNLIRVLVTWNLTDKTIKKMANQGLLKEIVLAYLTQLTYKSKQDRNALSELDDILFWDYEDCQLEKFFKLSRGWFKVKSDAEIVESFFHLKQTDWYLRRRQLKGLPAKNIVKTAMGYILVDPEKNSPEREVADVKRHHPSLAPEAKAKIQAEQKQNVLEVSIQQHVSPIVALSQKQPSAISSSLSYAQVASSLSQAQVSSLSASSSQSQESKQDVLPGADSLLQHKGGFVAPPDLSSGSSISRQMDFLKLQKNVLHSNKNINNNNNSIELPVFKKS